jgi:RHS repeat-associated protein
VEETLTFGAGGTTRVVSREYDQNGQSALVYPNGRELSYTRFDDGALHEIDDDGWGNTRATYDYIGGRTLRRMLANGVDLDFRDGAGTYYDGLGRPLEWRHKNVSTGATIIGFEYAYDRAGNRLMQRSIHDPLDSQRYAYDSASRLVATSRGQYPEGDFVTSPSLYCESPTTATWTTEESAFQWGLDGAGNWDEYNTVKVGTPTEQTRTDTNFNEIHQVAATTLTHNDHGDMTYDGTHQYKWDAFGRLREVRSGGGTLQATYYYDADHRRVRKDFVSGTDLDFLYDGWRAIEIRKTATQLPYFQSIFGNYLDEQVEADHNGGTPDATCTGAGDAAYGIQANALYSVYAVTRPDKTINSAFEYDPYGYPTRLIDGNDGDTTVDFNSNDTRAAGIGSTFLHSYTGQIFDAESGLYYYKRRYYHPALGRFMSRDPAGYIDGSNIYNYVRNNPTRFFDAQGLSLMPSCGCCGPEIGPALRNTLKMVDNAFNSWTRDEKSDRCRGMVSSTGWEIKDLVDLKGFPLGCPSDTGTCKKTAMVDGDCHYVWAINYVLIGRAVKRCGEVALLPDYTLSMDLIVGVWILSKPLDHPQEKRDWYVAGKAGWPDSGGVDHPEEYTSCAKCDKDPKEPITCFNVLWKKQSTGAGGIDCN